MKREAFIWRESVYKNVFKCNECGEPLADANDGYPLGTTLFDTRENLLICPNCGNVVAKVITIDEPEDAPVGLVALWGNLEDYKKGQMN
jgi:predicted RNA-binding Zn-ribbon protein involved in translation (DUF1610 family)